MAGEMREAKNIFNSNSEGSSKINMSDTIQFNPQFLGGNSNLIEVSDDDDDDDDDADSDDGDDSDDEGDDSDNEDTDEDGEYYDNGSDIDIDEEIKIDSSDIKVLKIELDTHLDLEGEAEEAYKSIVLNKNEISITSNDLSDLKQIILEPENDETQKKIDYKNLPLHKLKEIVTEKKINVDVKKLKKNEILKILGEE
jgi:hypothetical protein